MIHAAYNDYKNENAERTEKMGATILLKTGDGQMNTMGQTIALGTSETDQLDGGLELDLTFNFGRAMDFAGGRWWKARNLEDFAERCQGFLDAWEAEEDLMRALGPDNDWGDMDHLAEMARQALALCEARPDAEFMAF